eukprot:CAMPEP_0204600990 /NCGR_PEP_ID=MMETSP0661-20131031/55755_1 /ASSEMBLY_ACC=CAM_ASM_000606 /TAXON_ID=109239 /ORGANISM="Alexandrium margalefi, Strain AMGDE01CS-322" /LENGTH=139 /DNA_ID=CAMNT_0051611829 /DNA_START=210 /DNA_END=627 /DNA_ORIENTATION=-
MSASSSSGSGSASKAACSRMTWQVLQAHSPPQAPSMSMSCWCATSSMVCPGFAGTSLMVWPSALTKLTLNVLKGFLLPPGTGAGAAALAAATAARRAPGVGAVVQMAERMPVDRLSSSIGQEMPVAAGAGWDNAKGGLE